MLDSSYLPGWLEALLGEKFFNACIIHEDVKKNDKNIFCLDCCESICPHCLPPHSSHRLLQIRRYVYHDVIRLADAQKLMNCNYVQSYTTNSAKVVFLNQRQQTRPCRSTSNACITCDRGLQDPFLFCSLFCKLQYIQTTEGTLSEHLYECKILTLPENGFDDGQMTPDSVFELAGCSLRTSSTGSSGSGGGGGVAGYGGGGGGGYVDCMAQLACTATTEVVRKKRSSSSGHRAAAGTAAACRPVFSPVSEITAATDAMMMMSRRKGAPQRAPLY